MSSQVRQLLTKGVPRSIINADNLFEMEERIMGWNYGLATSTLHKAMRRGDIETAAFAAAFLLKRGGGPDRAWRRVLAFPSEDLSGVGVERVAALFVAYNGGHEDDNLFAAIIYCCNLAALGKTVVDEIENSRKPGRLDRTADELKNAMFARMQQDDLLPVPSYAADVHTGQGTLADWWADVNSAADPSPWREKAMEWHYDDKDKPKPATAKLL